MSCCVPGCINLLQNWTTRLPQERELLSRWKDAILAGSGQNLADEIVKGARVCSIHFNPDSGSGYREPTLFIRKNILLEVSCCRMCFRYAPTDAMLNKHSSINKSITLQGIVDKFFQTPNSVKEHAEPGYYCESCTVKIEMLHAFREEVTLMATKYTKLLGKMERKEVKFEKTVVQTVGSDRWKISRFVPLSDSASGQHSGSESEYDSWVNDGKKEPVVSTLADKNESYKKNEELFVKEETQLTELSTSLSSIPDDRSNQRHEKIIPMTKMQVKRKALSLSQKIVILDRLKLGERVAKIARCIGCNESTIRTIKKAEQSIRKTYAATGYFKAQDHAKRGRRGPLAEMENRLFAWLEGLIQKREPANVTGVKEKAAQLYEMLRTPNDPNFAGSKGWFENFKKRYGFRMVTLDAVRLSANLEGSSLDRRRNRSVLEKDAESIIGVKTNEKLPQI